MTIEYLYAILSASTYKQYMDIFAYIKWIDIFVLTIVLRTGYIGLAKGFSTEIFKFLGIFLALIISGGLMPPVYGWVSGYIHLSPNLLQAVIFSILVIICVLAFASLRLVYDFFDRTENPSMLDRSGGLLLGIIRGILVASFFVHIFSFIPGMFIKESIQEKSFSGPFIAKIIPILHTLTSRLHP